MKACNDITFLSDYWKEARKIGQKIILELPQISEIKESKKKLFTICTIQGFKKLASK